MSPLPHVAIPTPLLLLLLLLLQVRLCWPSPAVGGASFGVNATHILIGQTAPFSGLQAEYGIRLAAGLRVAFEEANAVGGVQSHSLALLSLDDGYDANRGLANLPPLMNQTLLMAGVCGSAVNIQLLPPLVAAGLPNVGPWTGAPDTRFPFHEVEINVRASYTDEMVVQTILLVQKLRVHRIACFYQNNSFGLTALRGLTAALNYVGLQLVVSASYATNTLDVEAALEAIAGYPQPVQAVVMASLEKENVKFLRLFWQDNRTDPNCMFLFISTGVTSAFADKVDRQHWPNLYFTHVVPPLDHPTLAIVPQFLRAAGLYMPPGLAADHISLESYVVGRLIVQVLQSIVPPVTRAAFLEELYSTRLYAVGGMILGPYSRDFPGCEQVVCNSSIGLRVVFPATLHPETGAMHIDPALGQYSYPFTELGFPITAIVRPLLLGQLLPTDDPVWQLAAETIGQALQDAFTRLNAVGGVDGRPVQLVQQWYSGDPAPQAAALADRYALLAFVGSVVCRSSTLQTTVAQMGTFQTDPFTKYSPYDSTEVLVQASMPLELMALTSFALQLGLPVHLRAPANAAGQTALQVMVRSLHSLQQQPASSRTYASPAEALKGVSRGAVITVGSDADIEAMFLALADLPQLRLLTTSPRAVHLLGTLNVPTYTQANRFHYPSTFGVASAEVVPGPEVWDAALYGQLLGGALVAALATAGNASMAYTTAAQLLAGWDGKQLHVNGVSLGPYYFAPCATADITACECNEGVRQVTVVTGTRQAEPVSVRFTSSTCRVVYEELRPSEAAWFVWVAVGTACGLGVVGGLGWCLMHRSQRDNAAAPKDARQPFCIAFTDIQGSTQLWATIPSIMAVALHTHHILIRRLLAKYRVYEVKTIGDSFMCAAHGPCNMVQFAVALQRELLALDWGTDAIDTASSAIAKQEGAVGLDGPCNVWGGLRVRVGIHHGMGEIELDPVSRGYDYYGTVVNTAARVEAVCHGGQIGITQAVYDALVGEFPGAAVKDLGEQQLRGLTEPVHLYQLLPSELSERTFPPLRLERAGGMEVELNSPLAENGAASPCRARSFLLPPTPSRRSFNRRQQRAAPATVASPRMSLPNGTAPSACSGDAHGDPRAAAHGCGSPTQLLRAALSQTLFQRASAVRGEPPPDCRLSVAEHNMATSFPRCPIQPLDSVDDDDDVDRPSHLFAENLSPMQFDGVCCGAPSHSDGLPAPPWTPTTNGGDDRCVHPAASLPV